MTTRRAFLKGLPVWGTAVLAACGEKNGNKPRPRDLGEPAAAVVYRALNGSPADNLEMTLSLLGGVEALIGEDDLVILKPNLQWFNQGAPNIAAMDRLVALIMTRKSGFRGEVVIAENTHRGQRPWEKSAWAVPFKRNSDLPGIDHYGDLVRSLKQRYGDSFSVCHLIDISSGGQRVFSPADGPGYVVCDGTHGVPRLLFTNGLSGSRGRRVVLSYPIL